MRHFKIVICFSPLIYTLIDAWQRVFFFQLSFICMKISVKTCDPPRDHWRFVPMLLKTEPTRFLKTPRCLENESILRDLFEKWHLRVGFPIDPSFLRFYLMNRITNGKLDLTDPLKIDNKICDSKQQIILDTD